MHLCGETVIDDNALHESGSRNEHACPHTNAPCAYSNLGSPQRLNRIAQNVQITLARL